MRSPAEPRPYQEEAPPLRVADPTLASGLRDPAATSVTSVASRYPCDTVLSAKAAGRVWSGGGGGSDGGRVTCWSSTTGQVVDSAPCASCVAAIALVPTIRPAAPLRAKGTSRHVSSGGGADGFACELLLWAGTVDGRILIYAAADLHVGPRAVLSGHRAAISCLHSPSAPPTLPAQAAAIVLSAAPDCEVRLWEARSGDCLRSIPCDGSQVVAMLALWGAVGAATGNGRSTGPQCRVWSAAANRTLSIWEPQLPPVQPTARPARVQSIGLGVDVTALAASTDGKLVGAVAGADGVLILDGSARLRARLECADGSSATAVLFIGKGRQVWVARELGGIDLWDRTAAGGGAAAVVSTAQSWVRSRRLTCPPLSCLCAVGLSRVWAGAREGTVHCWHSDAAIAEAAATLRRAAATGASAFACAGAPNGGGGAARAATHATGEGDGGAGGGPLVQALLRLLRLSLAERRDDRAFLSKQHQLMEAAATHAAALQVACRRWADAAADAEARLDASETARRDLASRLKSSESQVETHRREARRSVVEAIESRRTAKARVLSSEEQRGKLAALEAELATRAAREREMARSLAEARVAAAASRAGTERSSAEAEVARVALSAQLAQVRVEAEMAREAAAEMEAEAEAAAEALRRVEEQLLHARAEAAAAEAAARVVAQSAGENARAEVAAERRQLREANARMHTLLRRMRERLGEPTVHEAATIGSDSAWLGWASPLHGSEPDVSGHADTSVRLAPRPSAPMPYSFAAAVGAAPASNPMAPSAPPARRAQPAADHCLATSQPNAALPAGILPDLAGGGALAGRAVTPPSSHHMLGSLSPPPKFLDGRPASAPRSARLPTAALPEPLHNQLHVGGKEDNTRPDLASRRPGVFERLSQPRTRGSSRPRNEVLRPKDCFASPQERQSSVGSANQGGGRARGVGATCDVGAGAPHDAPEQGKNALTAAATAALPVAVASLEHPPHTPTPSVLVERRSAELLLQIMAVREWLSVCLGVALPPDDLPELLRDGQLLLRLAVVAAPEAAARIASSAGGSNGPGAPAAHTPSGLYPSPHLRDDVHFNGRGRVHVATPPGPRGRLDAFVAASRQLGVPEPELLVPEALLHPDPQLSVSRGAVLALASFAREAAARGLLPPLEL